MPANACLSDTTIILWFGYFLGAIQSAVCGSDGCPNHKQIQQNPDINPKSILKE